MHFGGVFGASKSGLLVGLINPTLGFDSPSLHHLSFANDVVHHLLKLTCRF
jgi:hypothetical protein